MNKYDERGWKEIICQNKREKGKDESILLVRWHIAPLLCLKWYILKNYWGDEYNDDEDNDDEDNGDEDNDDEDNDDESKEK